MNNSVFEENTTSPRNALVQAGDLIYQEVYRFAVAKVAREEVDKIKDIYAELLNSLKQFDYVYESEHKENMAILALDMIVLGYDLDCFVDETKGSIADRYFADIEFQWLMEGGGSDEQRGRRKSIYRETLHVLVSVYRQYSGFQTTINHRYRPRLIVCEQDYEATLDYFQNEYYLVKEAELEEFDDDDFDAEITQRFICYEQPFQTFRPYAKRTILDTNYTFDELPVPDKAISKRMTSGEHPKIDVNDKTKLLSHMELDYYPVRDSCSMRSRVIFEVDLSSPMSTRELEQTVAKVRNEICNTQASNRIASMLLSTTAQELSNAYLQPKLDNVPISEFMEVFSTGLSGKLSFNKVKLFLCGMMLYKARWLQPNQGKTLIDLSLDISERLTERYGKGFSVQNIDRGYQEVKRLLKEQNDEITVFGQ